MRNMSFSKTTKQHRCRQKDVTRRVGWAFLKPGDRVQGVKKAMGLRKGEKVEKLHVIEIVSNTPEPLQALLDDPAYGLAECIREGFPPPNEKSDPAVFVAFFCKLAKITPAEPIQRIEYRYVD